MKKLGKGSSPDFQGPRKRVLYWMGRGVISFLRFMPPGWAFRLGRGIGWICHKMMKRRRSVVRTNAEVVTRWLASQKAHGSQSEIPPPIDSFVKEVFLRSGANLLAGFTFAGMPVERIQRHVILEGLEHLQAAVAKGRGTIFLLAHMGPWEALTQVPPLFAQHGITVSFGTLYRPLNNARLDAWIRKQRESRGMRLFSRLDGLHKPVDFLRSGGVLCILADQKMREGVTVPFFGQPVPTNPIPGLFHRRTGAPMLALSVVTIAPCQWRVRFHPVDLSDLPPKPDRETLARIANQALETSLAASPCDGFWFQRRFAAPARAGTTPS